MNAATLARALFKRGRGGVPAAPLRTEFALAAIDAGQLQRYRALMGFGGDAIPLTFYYLLAQRAHLATMLGPQFPWRIPGMIHVANALEEHAAPQAGVPLVLATVVRTERHPSGAVHCVLDTQATQQGNVVFSCSSDYLAVRGTRGAGHKAQAPDAPLPAPLGSWKLGQASGREYASVSGDWNPIHLYRWSARLLGLPAPIIHGMHTMGKACALVEGALGRRVVALSGKFRSPIRLGDEVLLAADLAGGSFVVTDQGRRALEGSFRAAS